MPLFRILFFFSFVGGTCLLPVAFKRYTCGFKLGKMQIQIPHRGDWEVQQNSEVLSQILSQPFSYLDRGAQCYVFESADGQYVIKLFRYDRTWKEHSKKISKELKKKIEKLFRACVLAYSRAPEETGIVFLHLNLTKNTLPRLTARGPTGNTFTLNLDNYRFAVQKKVKPFKEVFLKAYERQDKEAIKSHIDAYLDLIHARAKKGIRNSDPAISRNIGFLEGKAYELDFGNYSENTSTSAWEVARYTQRLRTWLLDYAPEWVSYLDARSASNKAPN